ncbi:MAG: hypothetical protein JWQ35_304 [Bacteriovoracaceae bacterium]|nr:hypothetical protein [Bacteriovoracaceae bacterium]
MSDRVSKSDLLHDFQSELHGILNAVELVNSNLHSDLSYCKAAMNVAAPRADILRERWKEIRAKYIDKFDEGSE